MDITTKAEAKDWLKKPVELKKLTPSEKRVLIAKDVLAWLRVGKFRPTSGIYFNFDPDFERQGLAAKNATTELQAILPKMKYCALCAKGAIFVAAVARFNNVKVGEVYRGGMGKVLDEFFAKDASVIEQAFERQEAFRRWEEDDAELRLKAIMENIIKNKGRFKPTAPMMRVSRRLNITKKVLNSLVD